MSDEELKTELERLRNENAALKKGACSDLLQHWKNETDYISSESEDDVDELVLFLKAREAGGVKSVHFFFPNDADASPQISNHIVIDVSGFSNGFIALIKACGLSP